VILPRVDIRAPLTRRPLRWRKANRSDVPGPDASLGEAKKTLGACNGGGKARRFLAASVLQDFNRSGGTARANLAIEVS
jgi:hypothetical protein